MLHLLTCKLNIEGTLRLRTYGVLGKVCLEVPGFEPRPSDSQPDVMTQLRDLRHLTENKDPRWWVQSLATHASNFSTPACKKNQQMRSQSGWYYSAVTINFHGRTLIKVLVAHQHCLSLYCTRFLLLWSFLCYITLKEGHKKLSKRRSKGRSSSPMLSLYMYHSHKCFSVFPTNMTLPDSISNSLRLTICSFVM